LVRGTNNNTVVLTSVISTTYVSAGTTSSSSHTGAIVGGVAGGVVILSLTALFFWFCVRKRKRDEFDGDFDPDHVVASSPTNDIDPTLPHLDTENTPYAYNSYDGIAPYDHPDTTEMPVPQYLVPDTVAAIERSDEEFGYSLSCATAPPSYSGHSQTPSFPNTLDNFRNTSRSGSNTPGNIPSSKERETAIERRRPNRANEGYDRIQRSAVGVTQHQDGRRALLSYINNGIKRGIPPS
jgi:hypothetical protein